MNERNVAYKPEAITRDYYGASSSPFDVRAFGEAINRHMEEHGVDNPWDLDWLHLQPTKERDQQYLDGLTPEEREKYLAKRQAAARLHLEQEGVEFPMKETIWELIERKYPVNPQP